MSAKQMSLKELTLLRSQDKSFLIVKLFAVLTLIGVSVPPANAAALIYDTDYLDYSLPDTVTSECLNKGNCPEIDIQYLKTNHDWMNQVVNEVIDGVAMGGIDMSASAHDSEKETVTTQEVTAALDKFAQSQLTELPADSSLNYSLSAAPKYWGHIGDFELFEVTSYVYWGGAHGMPYSEYVVLDSKTKRRVGLDDLLIAKEKPKFEALAYDAYKQWVTQFNEDIEAYEKSWPFFLSSNVSLTDKGMVLKYQAYDIAPYAYGLPELVIPYNKLGDIVQPQYLAQVR